MAKYTVVAGWTDCGHLTPEICESLLQSIPPNQRGARSKGIPFIGAGLIWPVSEDQIKIASFPIPAHFRRMYGFDSGWKWNSAVWLAGDPETGTMYLYDTYNRGSVEPPIVAAGISGKGNWMAGVGDVSDINRSDGKQYIDIYRTLGLHLTLANKAFDTGIKAVWNAMAVGKFRVFDTCSDWFDQFRTYSYNGMGKIPDDPRHDLLDATRFAVMDFWNISKPMPSLVKKLDFTDHSMDRTSWMGV